MTYQELFDLISTIIPLAYQPSDSELNSIVQELNSRAKIKRVTNDDLIDIVTNCIHNRTLKAQESIDMTASINIAQQIIEKYRIKG